MASMVSTSKRFAAFGLLVAGRYWTAYYGAAPEAFQEENNRLGEALDAISVLPR